MRTIITIVLALALSTASSQADENAAKGGLTLSAGLGAIHNLDGQDPDRGTGMTGRLQIGYRTSFGLGPIMTYTFLANMPAHDPVGGTLGGGIGAGLRYGVRIGRLEPYVEASILDIGPPSSDLAALFGAGLDVNVTNQFALGIFVNYLTAFDSSLGSQPILMEGLD